MSAPAQHTPGPWTVRISQNGSLRGYSIEHQDETLRSIVARNWEHELCEEHGNSLPNARLIASAPELLAALVAALDALDEGSAKEGPEHAVFRRGCQLCAAQARAAIARATGGNAS